MASTAEYEALTGDLRALSDEVLMKEVVEDDAVLAVLTARRSLALRELARRKGVLPADTELGRSPSLSRWYAHRISASTRKAGQHVADGRRLEALPRIAGLLLDGRIGQHHWRKIAAAYNERPGVIVEAQEVIGDWAIGHDWNDFERRLDALLLLTDPTDPVEAALRRNQRRGFDVIDCNGEVQYSSQTTPEHHAFFDAALAAQVQRLRDADWAAMKAIWGDDASWDKCGRTDRQRRHDAHHELIRAGAGVLDPTGKFVVDVHMDDTTMLREAERLLADLTDTEAPAVMTATEAARAVETFKCETGRNKPLAPVIAFRIAMTSHIRRVLYSGDVSITEPLGRLFTGLTRVGVKARHRHCIEPGCDTPAEDCELDHTVPHSRGGPTTSDNAGPRCRTCHRWKTLMETLGII